MYISYISNTILLSLDLPNMLVSHLRSRAYIIECVPYLLAGRRHYDNTQTNKPVRRDGMVWALSAPYIMLTRPKHALPLARIYWKLFIFKYMF